ncbi:MAG: Sec-independent protein translocase subunit TatA [Streptosporangiaceae bacterium]
MSALVTSTERLQRLLALVPYVVSRKSVGLAETAAAFGVSERELVDDLNLLWCVELRAPDPYCPIDLSYEGGEIVVSQAESMGRPLRLAVDEASALLVALRMLAEVPALEDRSALSRLIAKLEAAAGEAASASAQVAVQVDIPDEGAEGYAAQIRDALAAGRRLHLRYYVPGRDEATERDVDPMRLLVVEGRPYLEGWCLRAEGVRVFRLDRVLGLEVLDVPAAPPAEAQPVDVDQGLFRPSPDDVPVVLELSAAGRWVAEYYPCESVTDLEDGRLRVVLRTPDPGWVRRLALRLGEDGRVISPPSLVAGIREAATAALANYVVLSPYTRGLPAETASRHGRRVDSGPRKTSPALKRTDMIGDLFDSPWKILIVAVVLIVLFGSKKLPHAARSLGQSMRILKKEVQGLHEEESGPTAQAQSAAPEPQFMQPELPPAAAAPVDQQSQIDALQQQIRDMQRAATMDTPPANVGVTAEPQRTQPS